MDHDRHVDTPTYGRGLHSSGFVATRREYPNPDGSVSLHAKGPYDFWVFSAYTPEYAGVVRQHLLPSLRARLGEANFVRYFVRPVPTRGSWVKNCGMKAIAILNYHRSGNYPDGVLWVDADAEIVGELAPLNDLVKRYDVCVLRPDDAMRQRWPLVNSECLSGTILFGATNGGRVIALLEEWARRVEARENDLDQDVLRDVLADFERAGRISVGPLPPEYVCIPDLMPDVEGRILHRQASRRMRDVVG